MLRPKRVFAVLGALTVAAAVTSLGSADAQEDLSSQFGSFKADAEAAGLSLTYDAPGFIPVAGTRLFQVTLPEAQSLRDRTPSGTALASLVYPGPILTDLNNVIRQGSGYDLGLPPYPAMQKAFYPSDAQEKEQAVGGGTMTVKTNQQTSDAIASYGAAQLPGVLNIGALTSTTSTYLEQGQVVSRSRTELSNVDLLAGLIHFGSVVTDLVATSDASSAATDGTTEYSGVQFLGLPATLDGDGLHLSQPPSGTPPPASSPLDPILGKLPLDQITDPLKPVIDGLNSLMSTVLGTTTGTVNQLLEAGGIHISAGEPDEVITDAEATRRSNGFQLTISYDGATEPVLSQLLALIPTDKVPDKGIPQVPITPQTIVLALKGQHILGLGLAPASVHVIAKPAFSPKPRPTTTKTSTSGTQGTPGRPGTPGTPGSRFTTPTPALGSGAPGDDSFAGGLPILANADPLAVAGALLLVLFVGALAWAFSGRLADNVLAENAAGACPQGLDHPPPGGGSS